MASELIAHAITDYYGERCPEYEADCFCCKAWAEFDRLRHAARPAPAATDTGLETVRKEYRFPMRDKWELQPKMFGMDAVEERSLVTRSQAEVLLAAERAKTERWHKKAMDAGVITHSDGTTSHPMRKERDDLKADNAAQAARIKELEQALKPFSFSNTRYDFDLFDDETKIYLRLPNPKKPRFAPETWVYMSHVRAARSLLKKGIVD